MYVQQNMHSHYTICSNSSDCDRGFIDSGLPPPLSKKNRNPLLLIGPTHRLSCVANHESYIRHRFASKGGFTHWVGTQCFRYFFKIIKFYISIFPHFLTAPDPPAPAPAPAPPAPAPPAPAPANEAVTEAVSALLGTFLHFYISTLLYY